ncbi:MAG: hypothetical protein JW797_15315 [Bradymonadales bacterium]|nr:hypothetical protein [Bradymonadales bacterium]
MIVEINIITGFLGSGKTSVVRHLLDGTWPMGRVGVLIREFVNIEYDIHWVENNKIDVAVLEGPPGICDTTIAEIRAMVDSGQFGRVILEVVDTSEAYEVARAIQAEPSFASRARLGKTVVVIDAPAFEHHMTHYPEQMRAQIAAGDLLILNKNDKLDKEQRTMVREEVERLNPDTKMVFSYMGQVLRPLVVDPLPSGQKPRLLAQLDTVDSLPRLPATIYRSYIICYDRVLFGHKLLNLPYPVARFKGVLRCWNRSWGLTGVPGQLDWDPSIAKGSTRIALIGLDLGRETEVIDALNDELRSQQPR